MIENEIASRATALFGVVDKIYQFLLDAGVSPAFASIFDEIISMSLLFLLAYVADIFSRLVVYKIVERIARYTPTKWDDIFIENNVIRSVVHIVPGIIFLIATPVALRSELWISVFQKAAQIFIVIVVMKAIYSATKALTEIYSLNKEYSDKPIKVIFQIIAVIVYFIGGIAILSIVINKDFTSLFAALGASMAILLLIFKDSILGFVAGWQLSANDMLRQGDWITVPKYGADGDVEEISLYSVKVRNFDNTITTLPPYSLVSESFQNWRGMKESGGRRVKRSVLIDMSTIRFCDDEMLDRFKKISYLRDYIEKTEAEIAKYNADNSIDNSVVVNGRRQTNIGVFRAYLVEYLKRHPEVNKNMTYMVRQLQPTERGIPVELYFFISIKDWIYYESVQSDIFDHVLAIVPQFGLKVFQFPTGNELPYVQT
ncbi:MAG: mechanosensitive ion channel [Bacteroidales bacterium]|jgi:miniconductance mechanosensitive channel|nr:mechanosensitive ion channel [Bacteroidales bacterium]